MNLLVVDDHPSHRKLARAELEAEGHVVLEAANGLEALLILERERVDAVISDILMPRMDGFRLCHEVRKRQALNSVPLLLYTATYSSPADRQLAETVGADGYLLKPAPIGVLLAAVREAQQKALQRKPTETPRPDESYVLEQYNDVLVRKLELRNSELQQALADLQSAHEQILELNRNLETRVQQRTLALDDANKELEAANQELNAFSYSVAHDLRAPLRHVSSFAGLLVETTQQLDEKSRHFVNRILFGTKQMDDLIADLLAFAHLGRTELHLSEVDLELVLDQALEATQGDIQGRNIQWERTRLPKAQGDSALLRQVFVNLISNAVKYTRAREPAVIEIGCRKGRADEVVVFVRDNGVGFDMRYASHLFGLFRRLHRADEFEGTGVGLANAHRIIGRHGGRIWAEAAVDRGATFCFSLLLSANGTKKEQRLRI
jgi:signal transduction histidine kinase